MIWVGIAFVALVAALALVTRPTRMERAAALDACVASHPANPPRNCS